MRTRKSAIRVGRPGGHKLSPAAQPTQAGCERMNDMTTTHTIAPRPLPAFEDDSPAGIPNARGVTRAFADSLTPARLPRLWVNAGHPAPLLIRGQHAIQPLHGPTALPVGS